MSACGCLMEKCRGRMCFIHQLNTTFCQEHGNSCGICERSMYTVDLSDICNHSNPPKMCNACKERAICYVCVAKGCNFCVVCISGGKTGNEHVISFGVLRPSSIAENSLPKPGTGFAEFCRIHLGYSGYQELLWNEAPKQMQIAFHELAATKRQ